VSPTVFRIKGYRFYFLSNEEERMHVHIECAEGEAKFWIEPIVSLADYYKLSSKRLNEIQKIVKRRKMEKTLW
jgi:predicted HTH domain antitoxin